MLRFYAEELARIDDLIQKTVQAIQDKQREKDQLKREMNQLGTAGALRVNQVVADITVEGAGEQELDFELSYVVGRRFLVAGL